MQHTVYKRTVCCIFKYDSGLIAQIKVNIYILSLDNDVMIYYHILAPHPALNFGSDSRRN